MRSLANVIKTLLNSTATFLLVRLATLAQANAAPQHPF